MMRDLGLVGVDEPVRRLFTQGMVIKDGAKMSKSKGNVVDPDHMIERFGADTTRLFSLFAAPPEKDLEWSEAGVEGCFRFLARVWREPSRRPQPKLPARGTPAAGGVPARHALALRRKTHGTIERVTDDLGPRMHLNTAVAAIMELINEASPLTERRRSRTAREAWALREAFDVAGARCSRRSRRTSPRSCGRRRWAARGSSRARRGPRPCRPGSSTTRSRWSSRSTASCARG